MNLKKKNHKKINEFQQNEWNFQDLTKGENWKMEKMFYEKATQFIVQETGCNNLKIINF